MAINELNKKVFNQVLMSYENELWAKVLRL